MKVYVSKINESWIIDRVRKEWYEYCVEISTKNIKNADLIWIIAPWVWKEIPKKYLLDKKVICSYYHFDFEEFSMDDFLNLDQYVDEYHVISKKTKDDLRKLTQKKITSIPFWVNNNIFFEIENKTHLRNLFSFDMDDYLIGSFQRDTEGKDLLSPKLIKGPDIFLEVVQKYHSKNSKTKVVLSGKRRQYVINKLIELGIPYVYFEMVDFDILNKLYNVLDLYVVSSRIEGGPQAILECGITKTPIISTDVGVAPEILNTSSIYDLENVMSGVPDIKFAYQNTKKYTIPSGINLFKDMLEKFNES